MKNIIYLFAFIFAASLMGGQVIAESSTDTEKTQESSSQTTKKDPMKAILPSTGCLTSF